MKRRRSSEADGEHNGSRRGPVLEAEKLEESLKISHNRPQLLRKMLLISSDNKLHGMIPSDILTRSRHGQTLPRRGQLVGRVADPEAPGILVKLSW